MIRDRDWMENALDPQWSAQIAHETLALADAAEKSNGQGDGWIDDTMECPIDLSSRVATDMDLQWVLYDLDLLPEQLHTGRQVCALRGFILGYDAGKPLPNPPEVKP